MSSPAISPETELHWLALRLIPGLGTRKAGKLIDRYRTPQAVFRASRSELESHGVGGAVAQTIVSGCSFEDAAEQQQRMKDAGAVTVPIADPRYPALLRDIFDPPVLLFARGRVELMSTVCLAVVGTRRPTTYGVAAAERLSGNLSRAGLTIASGMARGIDAAAHRSALGAGGSTVAVLGCGVDVVYPSENRRLAAEIAEKGLIVSEFPMGATAFPQNFPIRNRVISGLSVGVLVVEGAQYSGSAITAKLALDQGREVFAVPGNITSKESWGPNLLIKQGAKLVQEWNDVIADLPEQVRARLISEGRERLLAGFGEAKTAQGPEGAERLPSGPNGEIGRRVLERLKVDAAIALDELVDGLEEYTTPSEVIAALFELEMLGLAKQLPGKNFVKVW